MSSEIREKLQPQGEAVIFLVCKDGNVFLEQRTKKGSGYYGYTIIPGGKVESFDGGPSEAMIREAEEEIGIRVKSFKYLDSFVEMSLSGNLRTNHAFLIDVFEGDAVNKEPEKGVLFQVPLDKAKDMLELASSRYIIDLARKELGV